LNTELSLPVETRRPIVFKREGQHFKVKVNINLMKMALPLAYPKQLPYALAHTYTGF